MIATTWPTGRSYELDGMRVHLSAPVLVAQAPWAGERDLATDRDASGSYLWYPQVVRLADGDLLAVIRLAADNLEVDALSPIGFSWSSDGGMSWSPLIKRNRGQGYVNLIDHGGDFLHLPFTLFADRTGVFGPLNVVRRGSREIEFVERGIEIAGWPSPPAMQDFLPEYERQAAERLHMAGFYLDGQVVLARDGKTFLTTMYGTYRGDARFRVVLIESTDGRLWTIRSTVVPPSCTVDEQATSNAEPTICRLADGRIICVFRIEGRSYAQCFSDDDGRTWSPATAMTLRGHVEPSIIRLDEGSLVFFGGRPGIQLYIDGSGEGERWQTIDLTEHHESLMDASERFDPAKRMNGTSSYGEVVALDERSALYIYDCYTQDGRFGIYTQRAEIERTG